MTIPSPKASTDNVDSPYDLISQARTDILQNILNVNGIIDHMNVGEWTNQQYMDLTTLDATNDSAGGIVWDLSNNQVAELTLGANSTLDNPTNQKAGATYMLIVKQPAGANYTLAFDSAYKFANSVTPVVTATNNAIDIFTFLSDGTNMLGVQIRNFG